MSTRWDGEDPWSRYERACECVDRWELDAAERLLDGAPFEGELQAAVHRERALLCELRGDLAGADELYERAAALDPTHSPRPVRMSDDEAHRLLSDVVASLPSAVRAALDNVRIELVDMPDPRSDARMDTVPDTLGLYEGVPITDSDDARSFALPGRIRVFKRNVERLALSRDELAGELRITLLHEIGHHLGLDEDDLHERGLG